VHERDGQVDCHLRLLEDLRPLRGPPAVPRGLPLPQQVEHPGQRLDAAGPGGAGPLARRLVRQSLTQEFFCTLRRL